jgi:poly(hydroxyalkanoate) depolymerase family esterase
MRLVTASRLLLAGLLCCCAPVLAQSLTAVASFGSNPGNLTMYKYVPAGLDPGAPLVVALHGCSQQASAYDVETGWVLLAERWRFALLLPEQKTGNNSSRCFNWFENADISRGQGEALSIKQMVDRMKLDHGSDATRIYVTGLSAGGAFTAVMLAAYPDVFAAGAIVAGIPYRCGTGLTQAFSCMNPGSDFTPSAWGGRVRAASSHNGPWPRVSVWHGDADTTVRPANLTEAMEQWTDVHGIDQSADLQESVAGAIRRVYRNGQGADLVETWSIPGMGHGTPVDPGSGERQCGSAGAFILDVNICSSWYIGRFFGLDNSDSIAPVVVLTAPVDGAQLGGVVLVQASASDNVGVNRVEFLIDDLLVGSDDAAPYEYSWNAAAGSNGQRRLRARALDAAGNVGSSAEIMVSVSGGIEDTTAPSVSLAYPANDDTVGGTITLVAVASDDTGVASVEFYVDGQLLGSGNQAAQSGSWTLDWNTTALSPGAHALKVEARDPRGNIGVDNNTTVIVNQNLPQLEERFSDRDGNGDVYDQPGWSGGFVADPQNATAGAGGSQSVFGMASSGLGCQVGWRTQSVERSVELGTQPQLSYARKLDLKATTNTATSARFRVLLGGQLIDERSVTYASYMDADWDRIDGLDLSAHAGQSTTLRFEVAAYANVCLEAWARAWIDDVVLANGTAPVDQTPPQVSLSHPVDGSILSGVVDVQAGASDNDAVVKVEFHLDGSLLGVDLSAPYGYSWDTTAIIDGEYVLAARAFDGAGNHADSSVVSVSVANGGGGGGGEAQLLTISSTAADDGYVKAVADGSSAAVGGYEAYFGLALGRGSDARYNRALLSFDTSSLPANATVLSAQLELTHRGGSGSPWASGNRLLIDLKNGCFDSCVTTASDYAASASLAAIAEVASFSSATQLSSAFSAAALDQINRNGQTQLRLRFENNQASTAYLWIGSGMQATLRISYQLE